MDSIYLAGAIVQAVTADVKVVLTEFVLESVLYGNSGRYCVQQNSGSVSSQLLDMPRRTASSVLLYQDGDDTAQRNRG